jgi:DNA-binding transcriptional LysR family regulator
MQIESLKVFCDLVETESFTKAAEINQVTQSAVSQQISSLERQFKSLLIERSKKQFRLTREGQVLYEFSKQIIQTYDLLQSKIQEVKDIVSGTIRIATIYSIGLHELPPTSPNSSRAIRTSMFTSNSGVLTKSTRLCLETWWTWGWWPILKRAENSKRCLVGMTNWS